MYDTMYFYFWKMNTFIQKNQSKKKFDKSQTQLCKK